jgi:prepilin-type N-terminal cleavage/methylation domain-containing protein
MWSVKTRRFTLIELLTVMAIIVVLAALLIGISGMVTRNMAEARTKARMEAMMMALQAHFQDRGYYPQLTNASTAWVDLDIDTAQFNHTQTGRPYLEGLVPGPGGVTKYLDGWQMPFRYTIDPAEVGAEGYRLKSWGHDKTDGTEDDICSWKQR